jgi:hypothetical protein
MSEAGLPTDEPGLERLKAQLRSLPQPPVPRELEAMLLAAIPAAPPRFRRARPYRKALLWMSASAAVAAGLLLAVLLRQNGRQLEHARQPVMPAPADTDASPREYVRTPEGQMFMELRWDAHANGQGRDVFIDPAAEPFSWPLEMPVGTSDSRRLTRDLFD